MHVCAVLGALYIISELRFASFANVGHQQIPTPSATIISGSTHFRFSAVDCCELSEAAL